MEMQDSGTAMVKLVSEMVMALVEEPGGVRVLVNQDEGFVLVNVSVAAGDLGKVIGRQGRTARSMRTIVSAAARKYKVRCELNLDGAAAGEAKGEA